MPDRLRALLERPLDPRVARAVLVLASAVSVTFAIVAVIGPSVGAGGRGASTSASDEAALAPSSARPEARLIPKARAAVPRQDPQDRRGSGAARAVWGELRSYRALQHVPYRSEGVLITLLGARRGRALLCVRAEDLLAARRGWRGFLRRFRDDGGAYEPIFEARGPRGRTDVRGRICAASQDVSAVVSPDAFEDVFDFCDSGAIPLAKPICAALVSAKSLSPVYLES